MSKDQNSTTKKIVENVEIVEKKILKGLYLFSGYSIHKGYNIDYVDIFIAAVNNITASETF